MNAFSELRPDRTLELVDQIIAKRNLVMPNPHYLNSYINRQTKLIATIDVLLCRSVPDRFSLKFQAQLIASIQLIIITAFYAAFLGTLEPSQLRKLI